MKNAHIPAIGSVVLVCFFFAARTVLSEGGPLQPPGPPADDVGCSTCAILSNQPSSMPITTAGIIITNSGHYHLTKSFFQDGTDGVIIDADNVEIDLGGFTLDGKGDFHSGIKVIGSHKNITILNGEIENYGKAAINAPGVTGLVVGGVSPAYTKGLAFVLLNGQGIIAGPDCTVDGVSITGQNVATNPAVQVGNGSVVSHCRISNWGTMPGATCIQTGDDCTVKDCLAASGYIGIECGRYGVIEHCNASSNMTAGIKCGMSDVVSECIAHHNGGDGIVLAKGCTAEKNTVESCGVNGINVSGDFCQVSDNKVSGNNTTASDGSAGIVVNAHASLLDGNFITENNPWGMYIVNVYSNNVIMRNIAIANGLNSNSNFWLNATLNKFFADPNPASTTRANADGSL